MGNPSATHITRFSMGETMTRMELENQCDSLLAQCAEVMQRWAEAKVTYENLKDRSDDLLNSIMDGLEQSFPDMFSEAALKRMARRDVMWIDHKAALRLAREDELKLRIEMDNLKKGYELNYGKFLKS